MEPQKRKIKKAKGVEMCAEMIYAGQTTGDIVQKFTDEYGFSRSAIEKWIKCARPIVEERQREAEKIMARENEAAVVELAKKLNITRERVLTEYAKLAFFDIRKILTVDGGLKDTTEWDDDSAAAVSGLESYDEKEPDSGMVLGTVRKIKVSDKRAALDSICKVMGYNVPDKAPEKQGDVIIIQLPDNGRNNQATGRLPGESTKQSG